MWYTATSATVTNGSDVVTINTGDDISIVQENSGLVFEDSSPVEVLKGYTDGGGNKIIQLARPWPYSTKTNQPLLAYPTDADFAAATKELRRVIDTLTVASTSEAQVGEDDQKIMTPLKTKESVDFRLDQRLQEVTDELAVVKATHPYPWAMRKVEFEARRAANNEKFAASGFVHFGRHFGSDFVNEGLWMNEAFINQIVLGRTNSVSGISKTNDPEINIAGVLSKLNSISFSSNDNRVKLPPAEDGTRTYDSATGVSVTHATPAIAFASETATNKVVTDRVDMWGFEAFLREINNADPFVYKHGLIQSLATDINGVPTVSDNVRPITYFAWYEGDEGSRGKGVNWQTATEAQRITIASDPKNNIYFDDETGQFYQWCVRGRSFAGADNGGWSVVSSTSEGGLLAYSVSSPVRRVSPQGFSNSDTTFDSSPYYYNGTHLNGERAPIGTFIARGTDGSESGAVNGECYFIVCGTVSRLNQGAYHPSFNSSGSGTVENLAGTGSHFWYASDNKPTSVSQCFERVRAGTGSVGASSGRPDGRYYDAIYASGQGGVCRDMRYSSWGLTKEDFAQADLAVKSGEYRGRELLKRVEVYESGSITATATSGSYPELNYLTNGLYDKGYELADGDYYLVVNKETSEVWDSRGYDFYQTTALRRNLYYPQSWGNSVELYIVYNSESGFSIADEYTHTEVIGNPENILQCDDLKDGWVGSWLPVLTDGTSKKFPLTRPLVEQLPLSRTVDNGSTWANYGSWGSLALFDQIKNEWSGSFPTNGVYVINYKTKAGMTKKSVNSELYGGKQGIGNVFITQGYLDWAGADLGYSLIGKILDSTGDGNSLFFNNIPLKDFKIYNGKLGGWTSNEKANPTHTTAYNFGSPENSPVAFKALNYNVVENQQGFINYAYTELKHDGTDWGDDGKIHIVDNQTTMLDENGNTVLVGAAQIVETIGWIKNDK